MADPAHSAKMKQAHGKRNSVDRKSGLNSSIGNLRVYSSYARLANALC